MTQRDLLGEIFCKLQDILSKTFNKQIYLSGDISEDNKSSNLELIDEDIFIKCIELFDNFNIKYNIKDNNILLIDNNSFIKNFIN